MNLFQLGEFTLNSGAKSTWKIECDALTPADWDALAEMALKVVGPFSTVHGVPRGGVPFQEALERAVLRNPPPLSFVPFPRLVVDDVWTTGGSVKRFIEALPPFGYGTKVVVAFARGPLCSWSQWLNPDGSNRSYTVDSLFQLPEQLWVKKDG